MEEKEKQGGKGTGIGQFIIRVVVSALVLSVVAFLTPGFTIANVWSLLIAAVVIAGLDYLIARFTGFDASPFGRGVIGFVVSAAIIYATGMLVRGFDIGFWSSIIAALVIGIIDALIPGRQVFK